MISASPRVCLGLHTGSSIYWLTALAILSILAVSSVTILRSHNVSIASYLSLCL